MGLVTSVNRDHVSLVADEMSPVSSEDLRPYWRIWLWHEDG